MSLDDPEAVRREYTNEQGLERRASAYRWADGPDPTEMLFEEIAEVGPQRVLDIGCGRGQFAERIARELGAEVSAVDQSERMVELTSARGIDARVGDVCALPFEDGTFDCVLAAWMLFHVRDIDRALGEIVRVLRPGGRLVAVTSGRRHIRELRELLGVPEPEWSFSTENGREQLERRFRRAEARDATGTINFPDRDTAQRYVDALAGLGTDGRLPDVAGPLVVTRAPCVFVAET